MRITLLFTALILTSLATGVQSQQRLVTDFSTTMRIPDIVNMKASATHLYVLSESEGLVVFRTNSDTLQWILTSEGMTSRGTRMQADVRFAYLFGAGNRLTVLEPTSLLGVYSSTFLPVPPLAVARAGTNLFVAMGDAGFGKLSLATPALFDNSPEIINTDDISIIDVVRMPSQLIALGSDRDLLFFDIDGENIRFSHQVELTRDARKLHLLHGKLYASDAQGTIMEVRSTGQALVIATADGAIDELISWGDVTLIRNRSGRLSYLSEDGNISTLRGDLAAGNHIALAQRNLWVTNYDELAVNSFAARTTARNTGTGQFRLQPISDIVVPFPRPVIFPIAVDGVPPGQVRFQFRSEANNAEIRGNGFFWQPNSSQIGVNRFVITATNAAGITDSTSFTVDVRSFNAPPRFNPVRPMSIVVGEMYQLPIRAVDPDGLDRDLIRYHGVDLPDGATISERTGMLTWTPDRRQVGTHQFQVIATDQFGAATPLQVSITVRNMSQGSDAENGF